MFLKGEYYRKVTTNSCNRFKDLCFVIIQLKVFKLEQTQTANNTDDPIFRERTGIALLCTHCCYQTEGDEKGYCLITHSSVKAFCVYK